MIKKMFLFMIVILITFALPVSASGDEFITRQDFCGILYSLISEGAVSEDETLSEINFSDTNDKKILKITQLGIMNGTGDGKFSPDDFLTRQEAATALLRLISVISKESNVNLHPEYNFDDDWKIADWAEGAIDYLYYYGIIKGSDNYIISPEDRLTYNQAELMAKRVFENADNFKAPVIEGDFEWFIKPEYDGLVPDTWFSGGLCAVKHNGKYGYINQNGEKVIDFIYDRAYEFNCGIAKVINDGKAGYIDKSGNMIIPCEYDEESGNCSEDMILLCKDKKYGFADKSGKIVIPLKYDYAYEFTEGLASVKKDGLYGFISPDGEVKIDFKFKWASKFSDGRSRVGENGAYDLIDKSGEYVVKCGYDYIFEFNEGTAAVFNRDQYGIIDVNGKFIAPLGWFGITFPSHNGLMKVHPNYQQMYENTYGYIDRSCKLVIPYSVLYDANDFYEGLAAVATHSNVNDRIYRSYIDLQGHSVLPVRESYLGPSEYDKDLFYIQRFSEGMAAIVNEEGKLGFIKNPYFK